MRPGPHLASDPPAADTAAVVMLAHQAGWHPLGLTGIAAALAGAVLIAAWATATPAPYPATDPSTSERSLEGDLETRRAALADRLSRFPPVDQRATQIANIVSLALEHGLETGGSEYRTAASGMPDELVVVELRLLLRGTPEGVRGFVAGLQRESPWLAIDRLRFERDDGYWRGELQGRLFLREGT